MQRAQHTKLIPTRAEVLAVWPPLLSWHETRVLPHQRPPRTCAQSCCSEPWLLAGLCCPALQLCPAARWPNLVSAHTVKSMPSILLDKLRYKCRQACKPACDGSHLEDGK